MAERRQIPPVWLMGLANSAVGLNSGIAFFVLPQLLAARNVPEGTIAGLTAAAMASNFWPFVFGPILDIWFSRRLYATAFAGLAAICTVVALLNLDHRAVLTGAMVAGVAAAMLSTTAIGGWFSNVCPQEEKNKLSAWLNISVISGTGVTSLLGGELMRALPLQAAAILLGALVFLPTAVFPFIPCPGPDKRLMGETFGQFGREIGRLLQRRSVLLALAILLSPCSSFALTNLFGALGSDFHASARVVSLAGGLGAFFPGILGCLLFPVLAKGRPLIPLYLADGLLGSCFTLCLISLPHTPFTYIAALVGEYLFQAIAFSIQVGIMFETIGQNNPLAATTFTVLSASTYVPITYMMILDGRAYASHGVAGTLRSDAAISIASCCLFALLLYWFRSGRRDRAVRNATAGRI